MIAIGIIVFGLGCLALGFFVAILVLPKRTGKMKEARITCQTAQVRIKDDFVSLDMKRGDVEWVSVEAARRSTALKDAKNSGACRVDVMKRERKPVTQYRHPSPPFYRGVQGQQPRNGVNSVRGRAQTGTLSDPVREIVAQEVEHAVRQLRADFRAEIQTFKYELLAELRKMMTEVTRDISTSMPPPQPIYVYEEPSQSTPRMEAPREVFTGSQPDQGSVGMEEDSSWGDVDDWEDDEPETFIPNVKVEGTISTGQNLVSEGADGEGVSLQSTASKLRQLKKRGR